MANSLYSKGRQAFLDGSINYPSDTIKVALVKSTYTPDLTNHQFLSDLGANTVGTAQTLASKTDTGGTANAANITFSAVASGSTVNYLAIYKDTGVAGTSPLIALIDTATNLPVVTNNGDISVSWDTGANKIFTL